MKRRAGLVQTKPFAEQLLTKPNEWVRWWQFGRLSIVWDTNRPAPASVPTSELIPVPDDSGEHDSLRGRG